MSALASGADWLFIPEAPPEDGWENFMCERLGEVSADGLLAGVPGASRLDARGRCPPGRILGQRRQRGPMLGTVPWA